MSDKLIFDREHEFGRNPARFLTKIRTLDGRLGMELSREKGIPDGTLILVRMDSDASIPRLLIQRILLNWATDPNVYTYYIHSSRPYDLVKRDFSAFNWNYESLLNQSLFFEDMYGMSDRSSTSALKLGPIMVKRKTYLLQLFDKMILSRKEGKTCFSIVDDLLWIKEDGIDQDPSGTIQLMKEIGSKILEIGGVHFLLLPKDILPNDVEHIIMSYSSGILEFGRNLFGSRLRDTLTITKLLGVAYIPESMEIRPDENEGFKLEITSKV